MFLIDLVVALFVPTGDGIADGVARRRGARLRRSSRVESAIRLRSGRHESVTRAWRRGISEVRPGVIAFDGHELDVVEIERHGRRPDAGEAWEIYRDSSIRTVRTESAVFEWAVRSHQARWATDVVSETGEGVADPRG